jgi:CDP-diacylglycerol---glycerol-3-phosphate 3-phosphatidyltransferase
VPSIYDLKPAFQNLLRPLVGTLIQSGVSPNQITLSALAGSIAVGGVLLAAPMSPRLLFLLPAWLFARMALNAMDGMAAREHGRTSRLGGALNEVSDVVSDLALILPLARYLPGPWPAVALGLGAMLTEFCGVLGPALGSRRQYQGPMGKSDRAFLLGLLGLAGGFAPITLGVWPWLFAIAAALTLLTSWNRVRAALREGANA